MTKSTDTLRLDTLTRKNYTLQPSNTGQPIKCQYVHFERTGYDPDLDGGSNFRIVVTVRHDDQCRNGHESFSVTGDLYIGTRAKYRSVWAKGEPDEYGCIHERIACYIPEIAHLLKWHLCSTDGPMHYIANTVYHAGDRDHNGKRKGEGLYFTHAVQFGTNPILHSLQKDFARFLEDHAPDFDLEVLRIDHENRFKFTPKYTYGGYANKWHECPFDTEAEALNFLLALQTCAPTFCTVYTSWSDGKVRDLDAARHAAVWPEATDAQLCSEPAVLEQMLRDRLPALLTEFRAVVDGLGFQFTGLDSHVSDS